MLHVKFAIRYMQKKNPDKDRKKAKEKRKIPNQRLEESKRKENSRSRSEESKRKYTEGSLDPMMLE